MIKNFLRDIYSKIYYILFKIKYKYKILSDEETINKIINEKISISRFGDGEFKWIMGIKQESFQEHNQLLARRLKEVLMSDNDKILICIPYSFKNTKALAKKSEIFWLNFIRWYGTKVTKYLKKDKIYGSATFTRWYIESKNKKNNIMQNKINNIKKIWENKDLLIIEGKDTKIGVGNNFLENAKSIQRILVPSTNAFEKYNEIIEAAKKTPKDYLILLALGPTATILSYDLTLLGYQAIDVGHIDIEYEWYLRKATKKILIEGKYVNEAGGLQKTNNKDKEYDKSIKERIGV